MGVDAAIKTRPRESKLGEIGQEFEAQWKDYFKMYPINDRVDEERVSHLTVRPVSNPSKRGCGIRENNPSSRIFENAASSFERPGHEAI